MRDKNEKRFCFKKEQKSFPSLFSSNTTTTMAAESKTDEILALTQQLKAAQETIESLKMELLKEREKNQKLENECLMLIRSNNDRDDRMRHWEKDFKKAEIRQEQLSNVLKKFISWRWNGDTLEIVNLKNNK